MRTKSNEIFRFMCFVSTDENTGCWLWKPYHLEPVTLKENAVRGLTGINFKSRTHCPKGHKYDLENTYLYKGSRHCKKCKRERQFLSRKAIAVNKIKES